MSKLTILAKGLRKTVVDHAPTILTGIAVAGVATTAVMAVRATPEAIEKIYEAEVEKGEKLNVREKVQETWLLYLPAVGVGAVTITCIVGANHISSRRAAVVAGAYTALQDNFSTYREYVKEEFGAKKEQAVQDRIAEDTIKNKMPEDSLIILNEGDGKIRCCETLTQTFFWSDIESIRKAENDINYQIINDSYASMNDFYDRLGLPHTDLGEELGWTLDMPLNIEFSSTLDHKSRPALAIRYSAQPVRNYYKLR